jgi:hypothetical protein
MVYCSEVTSASHSSSQLEDGLKVIRSRRLHHEPINGMREYAFKKENISDNIETSYKA